MARSVDADGDGTISWSGRAGPLERGGGGERRGGEEEEEGWGVGGGMTVIKGWGRTGEEGARGCRGVIEGGLQGAMVKYSAMAMVRGASPQGGNGLTPFLRTKEPVGGGD